MKQFRFCKRGWMQAALLLLISLAIFTACKKDTVKEKEPECRIITISSPGLRVQNLIYDDKGRVASVINGPYRKTFSYHGDSVIVMETNNGVFYQKLIIVNNPNGLARSVKSELNTAGTDWTLI